MDIIKYSRTIAKANILYCRLANVETTFQGFAGADYDLQVLDDTFCTMAMPDDAPGRH